jgi:REP element-mobilizing transposase RayT
MPRPPRIDIEDGWHHVMNRGIDHGDTFMNNSDRIEMGQRLGDVFERFGIETHAYCLLDNHFHFLWHCPDGGLSAGMQRLGSLYTRHVNDRVGRDGALFRGRFHSRLIVDDAHLAATVRYIHRNALDVAGVDLVRNYRWSSHRAYLGLRKPPPWLVTDRVFRGWTSAEIDQFIEQPLDAVPAMTVPAVDTLITTIELVLSERGLNADQRLGAVARQIALAWLVDEVRLANSAIMEVFGIDRLGTLRTAISRARALMRNQPEFADVQSRAVSLLAAAPITSRV